LAFISDRIVSYSAWLLWFCSAIFVVEDCNHTDIVECAETFQIYIFDGCYILYKSLFCIQCTDSDHWYSLPVLMMYSVLIMEIQMLWIYCSLLWQRTERSLESLLCTNCENGASSLPSSKTQQKPRRKNSSSEYFNRLVIL